MATPERFAADFLTAAETGWKDVHSPEYDADPRSARIAHALRAAGVEQAFALGAGSFGVAAAMQDGRVVKLTTDETEVAAGSVLKDRNLAHVAHVYGARFVRGVHADRWDWAPRAASVCSSPNASRRSTTASTPTGQGSGRAPRSRVCGRRSAGSSGPRPRAWPR